MLVEIQAAVENIILPIIDQAGLELVELIVDQRRSTYLLEVLVDRPLGGITLAQCVQLNKNIVEAIDQSQTWADNYELVVASPGLDRMLKNEKDFRRMLGKRIKFLLTEKVDGKGEYFGLVKEVFEHEVCVSLKKKDVKIPFDKIMKAVLVI